MTNKINAQAYLMIPLSWPMTVILVAPSLYPMLKPACSDASFPASTPSLKPSWQKTTRQSFLDCAAFTRYTSWMLLLCVTSPVFSKTLTLHEREHSFRLGTKKKPDTIFQYKHVVKGSLINDSWRTFARFSMLYFHSLFCRLISSTSSSNTSSLDAADFTHDMFAIYESRQLWTQR